MKNHLSTQARALLEQVAVGDLASDAPEVQRLAGDDPDFAARLGELHAVRDLLQATAADQASVIEEAALLKNTPGEDLQAATVGLDLGSGGSSLRRWLWPVAAAAAAILIALLWRPDEPSRPNPVWMGPGDIKITHPADREALTTDARIAWRSQLPTGGRYVLTVVSEDLASQEPVEFRHETKESEWKLPPGALASLSAKITITVSVHQGDRRLGSDSIDLGR